MKILIDADGCPVVKITAKIAKENNIPCTVICDTSHVFDIEGVETVTVSKGSDSVDFKLVNMISSGDIVITQDYGLAAMCLSKKAICVNQNGLIYDDDNILSLLNQRHMTKKILKAGGRVHGHMKRTAEMDEAFVKTLMSVIDK